MAVVTEREREIRRQATAKRPSSVVTPGYDSTTESTSLNVVAHPLRTPGGVRQPTRSDERRPMGQRGSRPVRMARELSWRSPMLAATLVASFFVSLLCFYVTAYARVNAQRLELAQLRQDLKVAERQELSLKAEMSNNTLSAPQRAVGMGLVPAPPEAVQVLTVDGTLAGNNSALSQEKRIER